MVTNPNSFGHPTDYSNLESVFENNYSSDSLGKIYEIKIITAVKFSSSCLMNIKLI